MQPGFIGRKLLATLLTSVLTTCFFVFMGVVIDGSAASTVGFGIFYFIFVTGVVLLYGLPVSVMADVLSPTSNRFFIPVSLLIHIGFVIVPLLVMKWIEPRFEGTVFYLSLITPIALLFGTIDLFLKQKKEDWRFIRTKKSVISNGGISLLMIGGCLVWVFQSMVIQSLPTLTHYYIPADYSGFVYIFYDDEEKKALNKSDHTRVVNVNDDGVARTSSPLDNPSLQDKSFFYKHTRGHSQEISSDLIHYIGVEEYSHTGSEVSVRYDVEKLFIGTDQQYENATPRQVESLVELPDPDRAPREVFIPKGYEGWVKIQLGGEDLAGAEPFSVRVDENGEGSVPFSDISFTTYYDHFIYESSEGISRVPQSNVSEILYYPQLVVFYIGPEGAHEKNPSFDYAAYIQTHPEVLEQ